MSVKEIHTAYELAERLLELSFFRLVILLEHLLCRYGIYLLLPERHVGGDDFLHPALDRRQLLLRQYQCPATSVLLFPGLYHLAVKAARKRMVYHQDLVRKQLTYSVLQHEAQGTQVGAPSVRMIVSDELHLVSHRQLEVEFLQFVVHQCREHGIYHSCSVIFYDRADLLGKITEFLEQRQLITPPVIDKENFKFVSSIVHNYVFNACLLCLQARPSDKVL